MKSALSIAVATTTLVGALLWQSTTNAQINLPMQLPRDDFTWHWGDVEDARGAEDFSVDGNDGRFRCTLTGRLRIASQMSMMDVRQMESDIRMSMEFVRAAAEAMYVLDQQRDLDWATLACKKPVAAEVTEEEKLERESRAREKALREMQRRRERQQREDANTP